MLHARLQDAREKLWLETHCGQCEIELTTENEFTDREAEFWLGAQRDRYCVSCAEHLAEAQAERAFNLLYAS